MEKGMNSNAHAEERSLGALITALFQDMRLLFTQEFHLAKREFSEKVSHVTNNAINIALGAVVLVAGFFVLVATLVLVLALFMPAWAAALVVAVGLLLIGGLILFIGVQRLKATRLVPERTVRTVQEGVQRVKERLT
jgi:Flp pilus assembly protein TadB